jgi:hypothetical protein
VISIFRNGPLRYSEMAHCQEWTKYSILLKGREAGSNGVENEGGAI